MPHRHTYLLYKSKKEQNTATLPPHTLCFVLAAAFIHLQGRFAFCRRREHFVQPLLYKKNQNFIRMDFTSQVFYLHFPENEDLEELHSGQ
jgi:hypothetical protein